MGYEKRRNPHEEEEKDVCGRQTPRVGCGD
jgi:hypothetical protein